MGRGLEHWDPTMLLIWVGIILSLVWIAEWCGRFVSAQRRKRSDMAEATLDDPPYLARRAESSAGAQLRNKLLKEEWMLPNVQVRVISGGRGTDGERKRERRNENDRDCE